MVLVVVVAPWSLILKSMQADENYCCWLMGLRLDEHTTVILRPEILRLHSLLSRRGAAESG